MVVGSVFLLDFGGAGVQVAQRLAQLLRSLSGYPHRAHQIDAEGRFLGVLEESVLEELMGAVRASHVGGEPVNRCLIVAPWLPRELGCGFVHGSAKEPLGASALPPRPGFLKKTGLEQGFHVDPDGRLRSMNLFCDIGDRAYFQG